jgi:hypothetical protein
MPENSGAYRTMGVVVMEPKDVLPAEHRGPRYDCPMCEFVSPRSTRPPTTGAQCFTNCGHEYAYDHIGLPPMITPPIACVPGARVKLSGWWIFAKRCTRADPHLHQECKKCGARWTCAPRDDVGGIE